MPVSCGSPVSEWRLVVICGRQSTNRSGGWALLTCIISAELSSYYGKAKVCIHYPMKQQVKSLKRKGANFEKKRKTRNPKKTELFVEVPESKSFLDTATMPMMVTAVGVALFAKLLMMYDESRSQELIERKVKNAPPGQGTVRMLTREEWEEIREVRPRTPFESKLARPNARIRTGGAVKKEDVKDWGIDVLMDAITRVEESVRHNSR
ncbi:Serine/threonine-protein phosphatase with EF-hands 1 [Bienertia sinuspersici]